MTMESALFVLGTLVCLLVRGAHAETLDERLVADGYFYANGTITASGQTVPSLPYNNNQNLNGTLPVEIAEMTAMTSLYLNYNKLTGTLPTEWAQMSVITSLFLSYNKLTGTLPTDWAQMSAMTSLSLHYNKLTGTLPTAWAQMSAMTLLFLSSNKLTGTLPTEWAQMSAMTSLSLHSNELTGTVPSFLASMPTLALMYLNGNKFCRDRVCPSCSDAVIALCASGCPFPLCPVAINGTYCAWKGCSAHCASGVQTRTCGCLAPAHGGLDCQGPSSQACNTQQCDLTSKLVADDYLSGAVGSLSVGSVGQSASTIDYSAMDQTGTVPSQLGLLSALTSLDLHQNKLTGTLPTQLGLLSDLVVLRLDNNELQGTVPSYFGLLAGIKALTLSNNTLTGSLPVELGGPTWQVFALDGNQFCRDPACPSCSNLVINRCLPVACPYPTTCSPSVVPPTADVCGSSFLCPPNFSPKPNANNITCANACQFSECCDAETAQSCPDDSLKDNADLIPCQTAGQCQERDCCERETCSADLSCLIRGTQQCNKQKPDDPCECQPEWLGPECDVQQARETSNYVALGFCGSIFVVWFVYRSAFVRNVEDIPTFYKSFVHVFRVVRTLLDVLTDVVYCYYLARAARYNQVFVGFFVLSVVSLAFFAIVNAVYLVRELAKDDYDEYREWTRKNVFVSKLVFMLSMLNISNMKLLGSGLLGMDSFKAPLDGKEVERRLTLLGGITNLLEDAPQLVIQLGVVWVLGEIDRATYFSGSMTVISLLWGISEYGVMRTQGVGPSSSRKPSVANSGRQSLSGEGRPQKMSDAAVVEMGETGEE